MGLSVENGDAGFERRQVIRRQRFDQGLGDVQRFDYGDLNLDPAAIGAALATGQGLCGWVGGGQRRKGGIADRDQLRDQRLQRLRVEARGGLGDHRPDAEG